MATGEAQAFQAEGSAATGAVHKKSKAELAREQAAREQTEAHKLIDEIAVDFKGDRKHLAEYVRQLQGVDRKHWEENLKGVNDKIVAEGFPNPRIVGVDGKGQVIAGDGHGGIDVRARDMTLESNAPTTEMGRTKARPFGSADRAHTPYLHYRVQDNDSLWTISKSVAESTNGVDAKGPRCL